VLTGVDVGGVLGRALSGLPEPQRVIVSLRDRGGCEVDEVSRIIAVPPGRVRALLHEARTALHDAIEDHVSMAMT
jgi:RNA polymerase sigma-70 factor, ECF subfamily